MTCLKSFNGTKVSHVFINTVNFYNINCALLFITSNHNGRNFLSCLIQLDKCNDMFKVISDIMAQWYLMENALIITINLNCVLMISDIMTQWYLLENAYIITINLNCALMLIIRYHCGIIVLTCLIHLQ